MAKSTIGFSVYLNGKLINEVKFDRPIINVGKLSTSTLRLDDVNVSRKHAVIEQREDGKWRVTDLGSTNGTVLRGERVVQSELKDGDRIVLGTTTLVVHIDDNARSSAVAVAPTSGVAGDRAVAASAASDTEATAIAAPAFVEGAQAARSGGHVKPEEIRGLGEESFYKKKAVEEGAVWALDVAVLWGETVLNSKSFRAGKNVTFGDGETVDFAMPREILGSPEFALIQGTPDGFALNLSNPNVTGDVLVDHKVRPVSELAEQGQRFPIKGAIRARLHLGEFTVLVNHGPTQVATGHRQPAEKEPWIFIGASAIIQIALIIFAGTASDDLLMTTRDPRAQRQKVLQALKITPEELEEEKKKEEAKKEELDKSKRRTDELEDELKVAPSDIPLPDEPIRPAANPLVDRMARKQKETDLAKLSPEQRQQKAKELAQSTAMNQAFKDNNPLFNELLQTNPDLDQKPSPFKTLGMVDPNSQGGFYESGAIDPFGGSFNPSSGGFLPSDGGLPTGGPEGGPVVADILGKERGDLNDLKFNDKPADPRVLELPPRLSGELDEKTVQQYIRRYLSGIKWCYQDRLQSNRKLAGKVTLAFTILPNGNVHDARAINSSLGDPNLEQCIATKMARWRFPSPKDGGVVEVAYPLILKTQ